MSIGIAYIPDPTPEIEDHLIPFFILGHIASECFSQSLAEMQWLMLMGVILVLVHSEANDALSTKDHATITDASKYMS